MSKLPHCRDCQARIVWFRFPSGRMFPYDPQPVDGRTHMGRAAHVIEGGVQAWRFQDLVTDLQVRRECSRDDARDEAFDMPWHLPHDCPNRERSDG